MTASMSRWRWKPTAFTSARTICRRPMRGCCSARPRSSASASRRLEQAREAPLDLLDYVAIGGVYGTTSKDQDLGADRRRGPARHRAGHPRPQAGLPGLRHCRHQCRQRRRRDRRRRRRHRRDFGLVDGARSGAGRAHLAQCGRCCAGAAETRMTPIAVTIAGSDPAAAPAFRPTSRPSARSASMARRSSPR